MVRLNVARPRHVEALAPPRLTAGQLTVIAAVWLAMMAVFLGPLLRR
jgi:hypothetical protein